ncbi:MAG: tRNA pseudouridine(55) synthase TruB [Desulfatibacillum sp.]|nr:tRNA pseudouridine(55) synthase TruB [Desulfatibacillum sp.]
MPQGDTALNHGIIVVDKPPGITSAKALDRVKKALGIKKAGHTGTLDPFATGILVCCLGNATRLASFFLHGDKTYEAIMHLGVETDTQDLTGEVTARSEQEAARVTPERLQEVLCRFRGEIDQLPPIYSALKHKGVPLYKLARKGAPVQKDARRVTIHSLELTEFRLPMAGFSSTCSGGTYIRTLCADIGRELGCGAHLHTLRRTQNSGFSIAEAVTLDQLEDLVLSGRINEHVIPMAHALRQMPEYKVSSHTAKKIIHGAALTRLDFGEQQSRSQDLQDNTGHVKVVTEEGDLLAVLTQKSDGVGFSYNCVFPQTRPLGKPLSEGESMPRNAQNSFNR